MCGPRSLFSRTASTLPRVPEAEDGSVLELADHVLRVLERLDVVQRDVAVEERDVQRGEDAVGAMLLAVAGTEALEEDQAGVVGVFRRIVPVLAGGLDD